MKTNKSFTKRLKVSKNGKITSRKTGQNHFNAKESGRKNLSKKRSRSIEFSNQVTRRFLPGMKAESPASTKTEN
jgi:ribosomal protein L35